LDDSRGRVRRLWRGLSADRKTLVLIEPRTSFPRAQTRLLVLDAHKLSSAEVVVLHGDFSFDAVSPNGSRIFLIHYTSAIDPTRYEVRAYDVRARSLIAKPIVDCATRRRCVATRSVGDEPGWALRLHPL
jgi:hypothetical protein